MAPLEELPGGVMIEHQGAICLVLHDGPEERRLVRAFVLGIGREFQDGDDRL